MGARDRVSIGLSYRAAGICSLAGRYDMQSWFLAPVDCSKIQHCFLYGHISLKGSLHKYHGRPLKMEVIRFSYRPCIPAWNAATHKLSVRFL
jgi:hypothetical protein